MSTGIGTDKKVLVREYTVTTFDIRTQAALEREAARGAADQATVSRMLDLVPNSDDLRAALGLTS